MGKRKSRKATTTKSKTTASKKSTKPPTKKATKPKVESFKKFHTKDPIWVTLAVKDLERAKKWYNEVMEFETQNHIPEAGWSDLKLPAPGAMLGLNVLPEGEVTHGGTTFNFPVNDIEKALDTLKTKGATVLTDINDVPNMISMFLIQDSEGNTITILGEPRVKQ
ncbi:MAG: VOC family protein [Candidatus Hodarchaeales archaeon]|jgi:predicted enzyme related to lactoylglutathione lyase